MNFSRSRPLFSAALLIAACLAPGVSAIAADAAVNVYQFAIDNPVDDSRLPVAPTLGETVPQSISLVPLQDEATYAYFYYNGRPVIVDTSTRSVVRVDK
ncbi:DUF1236 domain-containing protein [Aureimonas glaciei]|uniref:DUF1236 domain-containing protein n=1 Tax=Aureimonas glaciei TaxID=1776957 RepID=A0A916V2P7_9HYPH|nr:DUF1236 domain-containing protein [Aureimonas glaciei]GGD03400.1 hypothetical protein GCM10011335_02720 [Aureimonas glaciei]